MALDRVPQELKAIKQWSISYDQEQLKRPRHSSYVPDGALSSDEAEFQAGSDLLTGFYVTQEDHP